MIEIDQQAILAGKPDAERARIAGRVGEHLSRDDLSEAAMRAAESLARALMEDAVTRVRRELARAAGHAAHLPRDIAMKIAHDVDSVACPFLAVTGVFSDDDWRELVATLSQGARVTLASRPAMPDDLALVLADCGDFEIVECLVDNPATRMTEPVCTAVIDRFESDGRILDKLAVRDDLLVEVAASLINKVSAAAREKLAQTYDIPEAAARLALDAETAAILDLIRETAAPRLPELVDGLRNGRKLTHALLLTATRAKQIAFLAAALSPRAAIPVRQANRILLHADTGSVLELFRRGRIPATMHDEFWAALVAARARAGADVPATTH